VVTKRQLNQWYFRITDYAQRLLDDLPASLARFTRIQPTQFAQVTEILSEADASGVDREDPEVWQKILEVSHG